MLTFPASARWIFSSFRSVINKVVSLQNKYLYRTEELGTTPAGAALGAEVPYAGLNDEKEM
jgi:hypothetical protein